MECKKCGKEIAITNEIAYCPYCSNKLTDKPQGNKNVLTRQIKISDGFKTVIVWLLLCGIFVALFKVSKYLLWGTWEIEIPVLFTWITLLMIAGVALHFSLAYAIYKHAKKNNRRAVAWATAFIVFTPVLAGLLYLLSWPKE